MENELKDGGAVEEELKNLVGDSGGPINNQHDLFPYEVIFDTPLSIKDHISSYQKPGGLQFACLLIPRFPSHVLMGDIVDFLPEWLGQVCVSYGWELSFINIAPEYLQWGIHIPAESAGSDFIQKIRLETSQKILNEFPRFQEDNFGVDFWAPGHLVLLRDTPPSDQMVRDLMKMVRRKQGL